MKTIPPTLVSLPEFREAITNIKTIPLNRIAWLIDLVWSKPYFGAVPYIKALLECDNIHSKYGCESAEFIVRYFLANASTWRGDVARLVKAELNNRLKSL